MLEASPGKFRVRSKFYSPPEDLRGYFTTFYRLDLDVEGEGRVFDHLQPEWANIRFFSGGRPIARIGDNQISDVQFSATGPSSLPCQFAIGTTKMWGMGITPLGWAAFFDVDAREVANLVVDGSVHPAFSKFADMADMLCDPSRGEQEQLDFIADYMRKVIRPNRDEAKIHRVHNGMVDPALNSVVDLADHAGMSVRTLERVCNRYFGFPPKLMMRRQRFMRSLTSFMLLQSKNWSEVIDEHYHDQAHFTREFREFMTMNPTEYAALEHPILSSFMEARARIWGSAVQTLDKPG